MTRQSTLRRRLETLLAEHSPIIAQAFFEAVDDLRANAQIARIVEKLRRGDLEGAIDAIELDATAYRALDQAIVAAYGAGGTVTTQFLPVLKRPDGGRVIVRFSERNPRAEAHLRQHSSQLITRIVDDQRLAVRVALNEGLIRGQNPRQTALDVVGRVNRATGRRDGGILGLTSQQERYVAKAREQLLSGDASEMRVYLERVRRDKRFDRTIAKAIREGSPLPKETVEKIVSRYSDGLLKLRGETIGRTETMQSLNSSQIEAWNQMLDTGGLAKADVRKVWLATKDSRTRDSHRHLDGQSVGIDDIFDFGMRYPGDPAGGPAQVANCRCTMFLRYDQNSNQPRQ